MSSSFECFALGFFASIATATERCRVGGIFVRFLFLKFGALMYLGRSWQQQQQQQRVKAREDKQGR